MVKSIYNPAIWLKGKYETTLCSDGSRFISAGALLKISMIIDENGFFRSGDQGRIDKGGFLKITGRIKELIITAGGENVAPVPIEDNFKLECPACSNIMLIGEN